MRHRNITTTTWTLILIGVMTATVYGDTFTDVSYADIASAPLVSDSISGNDDASNELMPGTIVFYRTSEGRYGKLQIQDYAYALTIRWHTYALDGIGTHAGGDGMLVGGTQACDLDDGSVEGWTAGTDFWWSIDAGVVRTLVPMNEATFCLPTSGVPAEATTWSDLKISFR